MYNPITVVNGYDRNYWSKSERLEWLAYYNALAGKILQPISSPLSDPRVIGLPFYGYGPTAQIICDAPRYKCFDVIYVGHNWWRGQEMNKHLLPEIERIRAHVGDICFVGSWWEAIPPWARDLDIEVAFRLNRDYLRRLRIQIKSAVPYTHVIQTMSKGRINIMTQRPLLRHLKHLTSKYFEIFCADTIPLVILDPDHMQTIYGPAGRELALDGRVGYKLLDALRKPKKYRDIVQEVRRYLNAHHSYDNRIRELVAALQL
jgi:hypothetical protein